MSEYIFSKWTSTSQIFFFPSHMISVRWAKQALFWSYISTLMGKMDKNLIESVPFILQPVVFSIFLPPLIFFFFILFFLHIIKEQSGRILRFRIIICYYSLFGQGMQWMCCTWVAALFSTNVRNYPYNWAVSKLMAK